MEKKCKACGEMKDIGSFYKDKRVKKDGLYSSCKDCTKIATDKYQAKYRAKATARPKRQRLPIEVAKKNRAEWDRAYNRLPSQRLKQAARSKLRQKIYYGKIKRGPCIECGTVEKVQGHHNDYSKPLEVIWLCKSHHEDLHHPKRKLTLN